MISRMEWAAGRKLRANAGETLTEVLISVLVIALGMTLFLSAFLASGRIWNRRHEEKPGVKCLPDRHTDELPDGTVSDRTVCEPG